MNLVIILCIFLILANAAQMEKLETANEIAAKDRDENRCKADGNSCSSDCECCSGKCMYDFRRRLPRKACESRYANDRTCERKCLERCSND